MVAIWSLLGLLGLLAVVVVFWFLAEGIVLGRGGGVRFPDLDPRASLHGGDLFFVGQSPSSSIDDQSSSAKRGTEGMA